MEEQTAKSDMRDGQQNDIPRLQSMLQKLAIPKKRVDRPKRSTSKSHAHSQSVFYQSLEPEDVANEDRKDLDWTVRSDGDEKQPTSSSKTEDGNEVVEERKSSLPVSLPLQTQAEESSLEPKEGEMLEDKNNKEPSLEEPASLLNNPSQQSSAHTSQLSMPSDRCDTAQMEFKPERSDEACGGPSKPVGMDTNSVLTYQTAVNVTSRTARSASDPVTVKRKEERPISAPSISNLREYENIANAQENSLAKTQKKGVKNKMKNFTHKHLLKMKEKLKEKRDCEHADSKSIQDSREEGAQWLNSMEMEVEAAEDPPPLPPKKGKYVVLDRKFTLKDFKLNLEPINLMEEIFTGKEWLNYLPSKSSPAERDTSDQPMTYDVVQTEEDTQINIPPLTPEQDRSEDMNNNQDVSDAQQDNVAEVTSDSHVRQVKQDGKTFAIPKGLLTNNAIKQSAPGIDCESKSKSEDIYDRLDMYIIPKNDLIKRKSSDPPLMDFSAVKSFELLDNSALKSRIRLSKKRPHKPPKKVKAEKSNAKFYKIPGVILNESPVSASLPFKSIPVSKSPPLHSPLFVDHT